MPPDDQDELGQVIKHGWAMRTFNYWSLCSFIFRALIVYKAWSDPILQSDGAEQDSSPSPPPPPPPEPHQAAPAQRKKRKLASQVNPILKKSKFTGAAEKYPVQAHGCLEYGSRLSDAMCLECSDVSLTKYNRDRIRERCRFIGFRRIKDAKGGGFTLIFGGGAFQDRHDDYVWDEWKPHRTTDNLEVVKVRCINFDDLRPNLHLFAVRHCSGLAAKSEGRVGTRPTFRGPIPSFPQKHEISMWYGPGIDIFLY
jgi:hypothetical protein